MIASVRQELGDIAAAIRDALDDAVRAEVTAQPADWCDSIVKVVGMSAIASAELLDDSTVRKDDIELVVREAARSFSTCRMNPAVTDNEPASNRHIRITHLGTHIATSIGLKSRPPGERAHPWAWLRVRADTPHADIAYTAVVRLAPGQVIDDGNGRAIPLTFPEDTTGTAMLEAIRQQIQDAMREIRASIADRTPLS